MSLIIGIKHPEMAHIPAGDFMMGSDEEDSEAYDYEKPRHRVEIASFFLAKHPVTVGEFAAFAKASNFDNYNASSKEDLQFDAVRSWRTPGFSQTDHHPVTCVSFKGAMRYIAWLNQVSGKTYRLPTEAEWEYAARAGTTTRRFWGDDPKGAARYAKLDDKTNEVTRAFKHTAPVGSFDPNPWGLHDMPGNVWEWTSSAWSERYNGNELCRSDDDEVPHVIRGGSWLNFPVPVRSAYRFRFHTDYQDNILGFRLAHD